jgi:hypothetical protein
MSMAAGLVPDLAGVVSQGVFLTPKLAGRMSLRMSLAGELMKSRFDHIPVDFRKVGLRSKYTPLFALASRGATCPDPTCQILHNSTWGMGSPSSSTRTSPRPPTTVWPTSQKTCHQVLTRRHPHLDVFGHIVDFLDKAEVG